MFFLYTALAVPRLSPSWSALVALNARLSSGGPAMYSSLRSPTFLHSAVGQIDVFLGQSVHEYCTEYTKGSRCFPL